mmetsp:Transcript_11183/g.23556  ORF Transcript_11183/g.23556 Transcript_11183/m.23556 type:complete len:858 (-) Transcript_11183:609-3182(-)
MKFTGVSLLVAYFAALATTISANAGERRNNLIVILTDQQRYDTIRFVQEERGLPEQSRIKTPNLDRIAKEGAYFRNAYTHCAVCGPARASLMTGHTIENTGIRTNRLSQDENLPGSDAEIKLRSLRTYDSILVEDHGYVAEYYGKWHIPNAMGYIYRNDVRRGGGLKSWFGKYSDDGTKHYSWGMSEWYRMWLEGQPNSTVAAGPTEEGDQINTFSRHFYDPDPLDELFGLETGVDIEVKQPDRHGMNRLQDGLSITTQQAIETIDALERLAQGDRPFSLHLSLHSPHAPMIPTKKYYDMYNPDDMAVPASLKDEMDNSAYSSLMSQRLPGYDDPEKVQRWTANYFGLITEVDDWMGVLLDKMDELGITENTLLAFSADHGEMMGGHGMREKNNFYEESSHIPLLLRMPGTIPAGTVIDDPVSHLDLHNTFLDYSVGRTDYKSDGTSLRQKVEGTFVADSFVVTMWNWTDITDGYRPSRDPAFMIRKGGWKLILSCLAGSSNLDMLYNLDEDPSEMNNLIGKNGDTAQDEVIGKAEHLKALLFKSLKESSHPTADEVFRRRTWRSLSFWIGDSILNFRDTVVGTGIRVEYLFLGTPSGRIVSVSLDGEHASKCGLMLDSQYALLDGVGFSVIAVKFFATVDSDVDSTTTTIVVRLDTGEEKTVVLVPPQLIQTTANSTSTAEDDTSFASSLEFTLNPNDLPTSEPTSHPSAYPTQTKIPTASPTSYDPCSSPSELGPGDKLYAGEQPSFICSPNGYYRFGVAPDGDLSLWHGSSKVWSAGTCCTGSNTYAMMQKGDGNLVVYTFIEEDSEDEVLTPLWASRTTGNTNAVVTMDDDGKARIRSSIDRSNIIWETDISS